MTSATGNTTIDTGDDDVIPAEKKPPNGHPQTPFLSPSANPVTPESDPEPISPPNSRIAPSPLVETSVPPPKAADVVDHRGMLAVPLESRVMDTPSVAATQGSNGTSPPMTNGSAPLGSGLGHGFPFPNVRPLSGNASPALHGMKIPPTPEPESADMSRGGSNDRMPGPREPNPRPARTPSIGSKPPMEPKKSFLHRMFHHDDKHKDREAFKLDMPKPNTNAWGHSTIDSASPPATPGTPGEAGSDNGSRPPSRAQSFRRNGSTVKDSDIHAQPPIDGRSQPTEAGSGAGGLMRRLSHRSASHGSQSEEKKEKDKFVATQKPVALVGGQPVALGKKEEVISTTGNKFTLKDLIGMGDKGGDAPKLNRRTSEKGSAKGSDKGSQKGSEYGDGNSTASLLQKYGICDKAAIGKGATAVVRLAHKWDRREEKLYAVKEFRKRRKNETEKDYVKKLTSEFCISSTLHHINVVETVDLVQDEQHHWCEVMEYCPGGDLYAAIKKGGMSSGEVECSFKQILLGIQYLHGMGVAHRDIKPENLLLDGRGHVKITDFGVSDVFRMCWEKKTHLSKGLCGSEPYIAPELFDHKEYDARLVDVWAAAIVFYCMQFQELPWRVAKSSDPTFSSYLSAYAPNPNTIGGAQGGTHPTPPPLNNLVPRECRSVIKHMLDPDPKTRWSIDEVLKDKWLSSVKVCKEGEVNDHAHQSAGMDIVKI